MKYNINRKYSLQIRGGERFEMLDLGVAEDERDPIEILKALDKIAKQYPYHIAFISGADSETLTCSPPAGVTTGKVVILLSAPPSMLTVTSPIASVGLVWNTSVLACEVKAQ